MAQIVVIDDMEEMRMLFDDLLSSWGHDVVTFEDGAPALSCVDFAAVDLVITDLQMPTPGQLVIRAIRACGFDVPILVVSGQVGCADVDGLLKKGAQAVMSKPPNFKLFRETVSDLLVGHTRKAEQSTC